MGSVLGPTAWGTCDLKSVESCEAGLLGKGKGAIGPEKHH